MKRRLLKSPIEFSAAETLLVHPRHSEKPNLEIQVTQNPQLTRRPTPDSLQKSMKKSQSAELIKVLTEKNLEIKKLQEENGLLSSQLTELTGTVKRYKKLKGILKKKNQTIDFLRKSSLKGSGVEVEILRNMPKRTKIPRAGSRLSIDSDLGSLEQLSYRPMTAANRVRPLHESQKSESLLSRPQIDQKPIFVGKFAGEMRETLTRTEKILKGWKRVTKIM
jgi:hypothetical protein